ncbi:MAG: acetyl-CoA carboxylase biotin carboxyl carrier protein subunit, partial [Bdellovibrionales bacterium]|nr:acetyl-CoA carboxylase biotin carboxyl carrier protein subunit [Bdellovibrionales bacterium]
VDESRWTVREVSDEDTPLMKIDCLDTGKDVVSLLIDGVPHQFRTVAIPSGNPAVSSFWVTDTYFGALLTITTPSLRETNEQRLHGSRIVSAPLPGKVLSVLVQQGKNVEADEQMVILESMKMEHAISSPRAAVVQEVLVKPGDTVTSGQKLVTLEG